MNNLFSKIFMGLEKGFDPDVWEDTKKQLEEIVSNGASPRDRIWAEFILRHEKDIVKVNGKSDHVANAQKGTA